MSKPTSINERLTAASATRTERIAAFRVSFRTWASRPTNQTFARNIGILLLVGIVFSLTTDHFLTVENLTNVLRQVSFVGITSCAVTLVMVAGGLDLSVGSVVAIAGVVAAKFAAQAGWPLEAAFGMGILAGGVFGSLNAFLVVGLRINPVISTLGTLYMGRGMALLLAGGEPVKGVPLSFNDLATSTIGPVSTPVVIFAIVAAVMLIIERKTLLGRWAVASGGNTEAARLSGIPIDRTRVILYILSGLAAGIAGIFINSRVATGDPNSGIGFEFDVIVAVILGGTALTGGQGTIIGTVVAVFILGVLGNGLNLLGVESFSQYVVKGILLVFAVGIGEALRGTRRTLVLLGVSNLISRRRS
jgi:ribose/xylose/arabinose/galactoside ABC-type transport system permease subunit